MSNKKLIVRLIWLGQALLLVLLIISWLLPQLHRYWPQLGRALADLAVLMLAITLTPGILKRWGVTGLLQQLQILLAAFRRQLGQATFTLAVSHYFLIKIFPALQFNASLLANTNQQLMGSLALLLLLPLFLTSNDTSLRILKKAWGKLHKLVYVTLLLVFSHLLLLGKLETATMVIGFILLAEIASYLKMRAKQKKAQQS